jgi:hypothetical protein
MQLSTVKTRYSTKFSYIKDTHEGDCLKHYGEYKQKEINLLALLLSNNVGNTVVYDVLPHAQWPFQRCQQLLHLNMTKKNLKF